MRYFVIILFFQIVIISCSAPAKKDKKHSKHTEELSKKEIEYKDKEKKKAEIPLTDKIVLKNIDSRQKQTLTEIGGGKTIFIEFSASWCKPCKELTRRINKIQVKFSRSVRFIMIMTDVQKIPADYPTPDYDVFTLESIPDNIYFLPKGIYPKVIVIDKSGEIVSELEGLYPSIMYMTLLSDILY